MSRLDEIREILTESYETTRAAIAGLREIDMDREVENGWSVRQTAGHVASSARGDVYVVKKLRDGKNATGPRVIVTPYINISNWMTARRFKTTTKSGILAALEQGHNDLFALVNTLDDADLDQGGEVFGMGRVTTLEYLQRSPSHAEEHLAEIRAASIDAAIGRAE